ncbi:MAG: 50S ribosomal protein L13 [Candidatus Giovannonibacteria bacterium GW2011_GWB1_46_20]|nr:MAG: 50S ribosomal protein L13 [Parcubacteria group bacterium GW2011_GWC1_44_10]KKT60006.1 MAG: 50S ribosomal protein L13 [Candidatus Giovannonibacteria bacterium GW2011_GWA1_44_25]KKU30124.1 MAG: 50S ribosomal protein L13 [Candidatus Giovannonibacteria bacterium GW2011_GWB1_46_20]
MIDAKGKRLGRIASGTAFALRGKTKADFLPHNTVLPKVVVKNADAVDFSEKKLKEKKFWRYSGYPGGMKLKSAHEVAQKDKREVLRRAVLGMLPHNRLRKIMIKNLIIYHGEDK